MAPELLFPQKNFSSEKKPESRQPAPPEERVVDHFKDIKETILSDAREEIKRIEPDLMENDGEKIEELLQSAWAEIGDLWMSQLKMSADDQYKMFMGDADERGSKAIILANAVIRRFKEQLR